MDAEERHYQEKRNTKKRHRDAFVRWQETSMKQMSYVNYLILTLSLAIIGFAVSLMFEDEFDVEDISLHLYKSALILLSVSIVVGIICAIFRLKDFRTTEKITRQKQKGAGHNDLKELRACAECLGKGSWFFLWWQVRFFLSGFILLMFAIGLSWL